LWPGRFPSAPDCLFFADSLLGWLAVIDLGTFDESTDMTRSLADLVPLFKGLGKFRPVTAHLAHALVRLETQVSLGIQCHQNEGSWRESMSLDKSVVANICLQRYICFSGLIS
jgi:hypothetical protein